MKTTALLLAGLILTNTVMAQETGREKPRFETTVQAGVLEGNAGSSFQMQAINGFRKSGYYLGLGVGLDYYGGRSVPVFLHLQKDLFRNPKTPFLYVQGGPHFPWQKGEEVVWQKVESHTGLFYEGGIGYTVPLKTLALMLSAGYSFKRFSEDISYGDMCIGGNCTGQKNQFTYSLRRISVRAGIRF